MNTKLYFANLPKTVTVTELTELFSAYGNIVNVHIATDRAGFVTMITPEGARAAIQALNGKVLSSGVLALSEVWPKVEPVQLTNSPTGPRRRISYLY
jgi:RNA recognition motif-containing protein